MMENAETNTIFLSVICPLFNEEDNLDNLIINIHKGLEGLGKKYQIVLVNDGSTDNSFEVATKLAEQDKTLKVVSYHPNQGRGKALREGFANADGELIVTIDADLSYSSDHILKIVRSFEEEKSIDVIIGSPYMKGGKTKNVPFLRLLISKLGNKILKLAINNNLHTFTGILRGYRREALKSIDLYSDGKEIHLEILSKVISLSYRIKEIPATLTGRKKGHSKFKFRLTAISHLLFMFFERPIILFGVAGFLLVIAGLAGGIYIIYLWKTGNLNPERPLLNLIVLLILTGVQILFFGFMATQLVILKQEIYRIQKENRDIYNQINGINTSRD
ncbi:glycosyltransferase family 2 protein [bacterium]|nr:glycosyltransferase family 2 protein [bacterium]